MKSVLRIPEHLFEPLQQHLFRLDRDEHGALLLAGVSSDGDDLVLLARELHLAAERDFPPGRRGYRQIAPRLVAEVAGRAGEENLAYLSVHNHPGATTGVSFSSDDLDAHERLFPHLLDLTAGAPVGGLVLGSESVAGDIWLNGGGRRVLDETIVVGHDLRRLQARRVDDNGPVGKRFDRQVRLFGAEGQRRLSRLHVAVVGAGGGGSLLVEQLAHLGVGSLTVVDFDRVSETNLSRVVGATKTDAKRGTLKIDVLKRLVQSIDGSLDYRGIAGDIVDLEVARPLLTTDFIFLATDTVRARLVFNAIVHRYLVPGLQIGAKVEATPAGRIEEVYVAVRPVFPSQGCLDCAGLIDPVALQQEARSPEEAAAQNYVDGGNEDAIVDPSVISLNGIGASHAVTAMLFSVVGLASEETLAHRLFFPRDGSSFTVAPRKDPSCLFCGAGPRSVFARGGSPTLLPCRQAATRSSTELSRPRRWARWLPAGRKASR